MYLELVSRESTAHFNRTSVSFYEELDIALGDSGAWVIKEVRLVKERMEAHVYIAYTGKKALCPISGEMCRIHSHIPERTWRHLDTMQYTTWLHCSVPRVMNKERKVTTIEVPWADYSKRYTHLFAAAVTAFLHLHKIKKSTAGFFRTSIRVVNAIMKSAGQRNMKDGDATNLVKEIGITDPGSCGRESPPIHNYNNRLNRETHLEFVVCSVWLS